MCVRPSRRVREFSDLSVSRILEAVSADEPEGVISNAKYGRPVYAVHSRRGVEWGESLSSRPRKMSCGIWLEEL